MRLIFLSLVFKSTAIRLHDVASHASNAWMTGMVSTLSACGVEVRLVGHEPARVWPLGLHLFPGVPEHLCEWVEQRLVRYVNMPLVRHFFLCCGYRNALQKELVNNTDAIVCTYNPLPWQVYAAVAAARNGARWLSFVLDDEVVALRGWSRYLKQTRMVIGHVFVSQWAYEHAPVTNKLLFEGGVELWRAKEREPLSAVPSIMYAGILCDAAGVKELLALIDATSDRQVEFWVCGKGTSAELTRRAKRDERIKLLGFLTEAELDQRLLSAWVLINPRSAQHEASRMNFPSKLLRYLSYGKPIVAVWTPGIPTEYRDVLQVVDPDVCGAVSVELGQEMALRIREVLNWNESKRRVWREKIYQFVIPGKLWSSRVNQLIEFIEKCNLSNAE